MNTLASNYPFNRPAPGCQPPLADPAPGDQPAGHPPVFRHPRARHRGPRLPLHPGMEITKHNCGRKIGRFCQLSSHCRHGVDFNKIKLEITSQIVGNIE